MSRESTGALTLGKIIRRSLLYVGLALASLVVISIVVAISIRYNLPLTGGSIGLVGYSGLLVWVVVTGSRQYWHLPAFWLVLVVFAGLHVWAFVSVLRHYPGWRMIWYLPIVAVESVLFLFIRDALLRDSAKPEHHRERNGA